MKSLSRSRVIAMSAGSGGAGLAAQAIELGLVDELRLFRYPVVVVAARRSCHPSPRAATQVALLDALAFDGPSTLPASVAATDDERG